VSCLVNFCLLRGFYRYEKILEMAVPLAASRDLGGTVGEDETPKELVAAVVEWFV